jgi:hypothetical protein
MTPAIKTEHTSWQTVKEAAMGECRHSHNCPGTWRTEKSENFESEDTPYRRGVFGSRRAILESNTGQIFRTLPMGWALGAP